MNLDDIIASHSNPSEPVTDAHEASPDIIVIEGWHYVMARVNMVKIDRRSSDKPPTVIEIHTPDGDARGEQRYRWFETDHVDEIMATFEAHPSFRRCGDCLVNDSRVVAWRGYPRFIDGSYGWLSDNAGSFASGYPGVVKVIPPTPKKNESWAGIGEAFKPYLKELEKAGVNFSGLNSK